MILNGRKFQLRIASSMHSLYLTLKSSCMTQLPTNSASMILIGIKSPTVSLISTTRSPASLFLPTMTMLAGFRKPVTLYSLICMSSLCI